MFDIGYKRLLSDSNGNHYGQELFKIYDKMLVMNEKIIQKLQNICGSQNILLKKEELEDYSHDEIQEKTFFPLNFIR